MTDNTLMPCPCPFCKFRSSLSPRPTQWEGGKWQLQCGRCGACSPVSSTKEGAYEEWNKRVISWTQEDYEKAGRAIYEACVKSYNAHFNHNELDVFYSRLGKAALDAVGKNNLK